VIVAYRERNETPITSGLYTIRRHRDSAIYIGGQACTWKYVRTEKIHLRGDLTHNIL